jgi:hypothetical protein
MRSRTIALGLACLALLLVANSAFAAFIPGLHNTGEAGIGVADAFYNGPPVDSGPGGPAVAIGVTPFSTYVSTGLAAGSNWISFQADPNTTPTSVPAGLYNYYYNTPNLSAYSNISIEFDMASDNSVRVFLNGSLTPVVSLVTAPPGDVSTFGTLHHFVISTGLLSGVNNFLFQTENYAIDSYNPQSLLVTNIQGTGTDNTPGVVPEPASFMAWGAWSAVGLAMSSWRRKRSAIQKNS